MSAKNTDPELLRNDGSVKFLQGTDSRFQKDLSGKRGYYSAVRHMRFQPSMQNKFLQSVDSQVVPLQLPNPEFQIPPPVTGYLVSETGFYLLSENDQNLIQE